METSIQNDKKSKKVLSMFGNVILGINILIILSFAITFFMNGCNFHKANVFVYRLVTVLSGSMEPTLSTHGMAVCDMTGDDYDTGDIIVFKQNVDGVNLLVIHRIIDITDDGSYITKGDNNPKADNWIVNKDQVSGKVCSIWNWTAPIIDFIGGKQ